MFTTRAAVTWAGTASVCALQSAPTLRPVWRPGCLQLGGPGQSAVSLWRPFAILVQIFKCSTAALQCEAGSSYQPCVSTCPLPTCDNWANYNKVSLACREEPCVEGCAPDTCRQGEVHQSRDVLECINSINCRTKCRMENGTQFYEGDVMEESDCKSW